MAQRTRLAENHLFWDVTVSCSIAISSQPKGDSNLRGHQVDQKLTRIKLELKLDFN